MKIYISILTTLIDFKVKSSAFAKFDGKQNNMTVKALNQHAIVIIVDKVLYKF